MARRSGLGRGLGALIPTDITGEPGTGLREVPVGSISPNPHQPRSYFDEESLASLTASVAELGVLQPVLVREVGDERFELIAGERRWRAAKRAGLPSIPVVVREVDEVLSLEQALVENLHREDLNPLEEAAAYQQLMEDFELTQEAVAQKVGKSPLGGGQHPAPLPAPAVDPAARGREPARRRARQGAARARRTGPSRRRWPSGSWPTGCRCARPRRRCGATTRRPTRKPRTPTARSRSTPGAGPPQRLRPPGLLELEELLAAHLDTRVRVSMAGSDGKGKVVVEFGGPRGPRADLPGDDRGATRRPDAARNARDPRHLVEGLGVQHKVDLVHNLCGTLWRTSIRRGRR